MNKPRLIDANELKKHITSYVGMWEDGDFYVEIEAVLRGIDSQPTAYDIDKVVESLESLNRTYVDLANIRCDPYCDGMVEGIETAIEIVKGGINNE